MAHPAERTAALLVAQLAKGVITLNAQVENIDRLVEDGFHRHPQAKVIISMPGIGVLLAATRAASGNLHRPQRYSRPLQRAFCTSARISVQSTAVVAGLAEQVRPATFSRKTTM